MSSYHHPGLRGQLVTAAISHVRTHGTETLSIRALTGSLGVTPNAAYRHFPNRQRLLEEVAAHACRDLHHRLQQHLNHPTPPGDAGTAEPTEALCREYIAYARTEPHLFRAMLLTPGNDDHHPAPSNDLPDPPSSVLPATPLSLSWPIVHGFAALATAGPLRALSDVELDRATNHVIRAALFFQPPTTRQQDQEPEDRKSS